MKIMTYNILHEVRGEGPGEGYDDQIRILAELSGYPYYYFANAKFFEGRGPYGNALLSKIPFEQVETITIPDPALKTGPKNYETRCLLKAKLQGGITVLVTHFGLNPDEEVNAVLTLLRNAPKKKCIVMGDFNTEPHNGYLQPLQDRMKDAADLLAPDTYTFSINGINKKIDYIFVSKDIEILEAAVPEIYVSDHFPHTATIQIQEI